MQAGIEVAALGQGVVVVLLDLSKCYERIPLLELARNATYMSLSVAATMDGFLLAGMAAFLPKYFESQFMLSPGDAAMLVGVLVVPAGASGVILGGYLGKRLKLDRAGYIKMYVVCQGLFLRI